MRTMKIIHVDDHQLFVEGLKAVLEHTSVGHTILAAANAEDAIKLVEQNLDTDLVMVDLTLPGMDGHALIKALFERNLIIPVVVMSAVDDLWQIKRCMDEGAMGFIPKSIETAEMITAIQRLVQGETFLPDELREKLENLPDKAPEGNVEKLAAAYHITSRQMEVLNLMREGYGNQDIANILCLSEHTIKSHARVLFQALGVSNRVECIRNAERAGLLA